MLKKPISVAAYYWATTLFTVLGMLTACMIVLSNVKAVYPPSGSMLPTLDYYETVLLTVVDENTRINRGDIVCFDPGTEWNGYYGHYKDGSVDNYIKRVIGLPGDTIEVKDGHLYVNGVVQNEEYVRDDIINEDFAEVVVPEGCYFMMGDNRNFSADSRYIGPIPFENVTGRAFFHMDSLVAKYVKANGLSTP